MYVCFGVFATCLFMFYVFGLWFCVFGCLGLVCYFELVFYVLGLLFVLGFALWFLFVFGFGAFGVLDLLAILVVLSHFGTSVVFGC